MSGPGEGGGGEAKLSDCLNWQHIVSQKRKVMQKWRPETHNVQAFSYALNAHIFALYLVVLYSNTKCEGRRGRTVNSFGSARQKYVGVQCAPSLNRVKRGSHTSQ